MAKNKTLPKIEKGILLIIKKAEFDEFATTSSFSDDLKKLIINITDICFNAGCDAILFLLNHLDYDYQCDSFIPICKDAQILTVLDATKNIENVICLRPYACHELNKLLDKQTLAFDDILYKIFRYESNWTKEYAFGIGDDTMPIKEIKLSPYLADPSSYISRELLSSLEKEFCIYRDIAQTHPEYKRFVYEIVKDIEQVRKELDSKEGFTQLQMETHDFAIRIPEQNLTKETVFDGNLFTNLKMFIDSCIEKITPHFKNEYNLGITAVGYGSTTLFVDIIPSSKNRNKEQEVNIKQETKEVGGIVKNILKESLVLVEKSSASDDEKLDLFLEKTKLEPEKAAGIIQKLENLFPKNTTTYQNVDVYVQSEEPTCVSFSKENIQSFGNVKRTIIEQTKEEFENEISGLLGAVEVWNKEEPKFKIKTDTGKRKTICYEASEENEKKVKSMIGKNIKIQISQDGKSNILERWLA